MFQNEKELLRWAKKGQRPGVTLGQLLTLLELCESESVAAMSGGDVSNAVNFRQKLDRLEKSLEVGRLTTRSGKVTRPTELGKGIAAEVKALLLELAKKSQASKREATWVFGAGETWLQSVVVPTLARWPVKERRKNWQVTNLRKSDLCAGLREGKVHFGLLRNADLVDEPSLEVVRTFPGAGYSVVISGAPMIGTLTEALQWVRRENHPLIQQGTSWPAYRAALAEPMGTPDLEQLEPNVVCESHPQALASVTNGRGWTVAPSVVARRLQAPAVVVFELPKTRTNDGMALVICRRMLSKLDGGLDAVDALKRELGLTISGLKK
jgi:DNA-binding transcriptional LysR family regulator